MTPEQFCAVYPRLYHMAEAAAWPSIRRHGLLSTSALLDLYGVNGAERERIERQRRPAAVPITHPEFGEMFINDQHPMTDETLRPALIDMTPSEWYAHLNARVFFWVSEARLGRLLNTYRSATRSCSCSIPPKCSPATPRKRCSRRSTPVSRAVSRSAGAARRSSRWRIIRSRNGCASAACARPWRNAPCSAAWHTSRRRWWRSGNAECRMQNAKVQRQEKSTCRRASLVSERLTREDLAFPCDSPSEVFRSVRTSAF